MSERVGNDKSPAEKIRDGLDIMLAHGRVEVCAHHDELLAMIVGDVPLTKYAEKRLEDLGWRWRAEEDCWRILT